MLGQSIGQSDGQWVSWLISQWVGQSIGWVGWLIDQTLGSVLEIVPNFYFWQVFVTKAEREICNMGHYIVTTSPTDMHTARLMSN